MNKNTMRDVLNRGDVAIGSWVDLFDSIVVEIMGRVGYDFIVLDIEHSGRDPSNTLALLTAADVVGVPVLMRTREVSESLFQWILDLGAIGFITAHCDTKEDAIHAVKCTKYPPMGHRGSFTTSRQTQFGESAAFFQHVKDANEQTVVMPLIESVAGVKNIDEILSVDGVDGVFWGHADLSLDMGLPYEPKWNNPKLLEARDKIFEAAKRHNKWLAVFVSDADRAADLVKRGVNIVMFGHDTFLIKRLYANALAELRAKTKRT